MTQEEMRHEFHALYNMMANSNKVEYMHIFGNVHKEMMDWMIVNKPDVAEEMLQKLEAIKWKNYLTPKEAEGIVSRMEPEAPWSRDQWRQVMQQHGLDTENEPYYNPCALWVTMNMIMSDSGKTVAEYVASDNLFKFVYQLAVDKLTDRDRVFNIRHYFSV